ncbi:MAG TPA: hypothetical protein VGC53_15665 [Vicinamibacteria bacterium]|jgi:hypothetical protein
MVKYCTAVGVVIALLAGLSVVWAQKTTERFIPIGQSPGLSGEYTKIGSIESVSVQEQTVMMSDPSGGYSVRLAEDTQIWLDKSKLGATNEVGTVSDLMAGRRIEVKYKDNDPNAAAEWIKVEMVE